MRQKTTPESNGAAFDTSPLKPLPPGWCWAQVKDVGDVKLGRQRSPEHHTGAHMRPYLRVANVFENCIDLSDVLRMNFTPAEFETYQLRFGDILLNEGQSLELVGRAAMYRDELPGSCFQNTLVRFRPYPCVEPGFALYLFIHYLHSHRFQRIAKWTVNIAHLGAGRFAEIEFPLPPVNEQRRIVARIEELFSDLDAAVVALKRAKANLTNYRAAVLKAAIEGKLTAEWRPRYPTEPASKRLERILDDRRCKWEADQLAKFAAAGKELPRNWKAKYAAPTPATSASPPNLPDGWCRVSIDQVAECLDYLRVPINREERERRGGTIPYYGANGQVGWIDSFLFDEPLVLVVEDETFVGREKPFSYKITGKSWVNNHAHILRATSAIDIDFLHYALMYYPFVPLTTGTTARRKLTKGKLMSAPIALPPLDEQRFIVNEVAERLSHIEAAEVAIDRSLLRASRLRQSILTHAFQGTLVLRDSGNEGASLQPERPSLTDAHHDGNGRHETAGRPRPRRKQSETYNAEGDE